MNSIQDHLSKEILSFYPNSIVKKINIDNYLDIHLPNVNEKKGTHLVFNTSNGKIKIGFYCRDQDFVEKLLTSTDLLEATSHGVRPFGNPEFLDVTSAIKMAKAFIQLLILNSSSRVSEKKEDTKNETEKVKIKDENDDRGLPMMRVKNPSIDLKSAVQKYLSKWQTPTMRYDRRLGITCYIPDFVEDLISDDICPIFSNKQIEIIYKKITDKKEIPILNYVPVELFEHTKKVWWIVPFCILKEDTASMLFIDKNGIYAFIEIDGVKDLVLIFSWEKVGQIYFQCQEQDPNLCTLKVISYENEDQFLTIDEFIPDGDHHGSYLKVIHAIWHTRYKTIEASRGEPFWLEGEGGESFKEYEHPTELYN